MASCFGDLAVLDVRKEYHLCHGQEAEGEEEEGEAPLTACTSDPSTEEIESGYSKLIPALDT